MPANTSAWSASWNLLWNVGGPEPLLPHRTYLTFEEVNRLGAEIAKLDPFQHPISVHHFTADTPFRDQSWLSYGTLQGPKTFNRAQLRDGLLRNHHPKKPLLAQETLWSGNSVHIRANKGTDYSDADLRKNAYVIHFSASYLVFADNNGDSSTGFTGSMELGERRQPRHDILKLVWDTVAPLPWQNTTPHPELVSTVAGQGHAFCLADPGRTYLVYLETPGTVNVRVTEGPYKVEWINATNPSDRRPAGETRDGQNLASPREADDWILVLRRSQNSTQAERQNMDRNEPKGRLVDANHDSFHAARRSKPSRPAVRRFNTMNISDPVSPAGSCCSRSIRTSPRFALYYFNPEIPHLDHSKLSAIENTPSRDHGHWANIVIGCAAPGPSAMAL